jgi:hypothetical protein
VGPRVGLDVVEKTKVSAADSLTVFPTFPVRSLSYTELIQQVWMTCTLKVRLSRVTYTRYTDTINSPDDGHMAARNMKRIEINIYKKDCASSWLFTNIFLRCLHTRYPERQPRVGTDVIRVSALKRLRCYVPLFMNVVMSVKSACSTVTVVSCRLI